MAGQQHEFEGENFEMAIPRPRPLLPGKRSHRDEIKTVVYIPHIIRVVNSERSCLMIPSGSDIEIVWDTLWAGYAAHEKIKAEAI